MTHAKKRVAIATGVIILLVAVGFIASNRKSSHQQMISILKDLTEKSNSFSNPFSPEGKLNYCNSFLKSEGNYQDVGLLTLKAPVLLKVGREKNQ